jgi:hypothetical protein
MLNPDKAAQKIAIDCGSGFLSASLITVSLYRDYCDSAEEEWPDLEAEENLETSGRSASITSIANFFLCL